MNSIYFTQFKQPDGRQEQISIERPNEVVELAQKVIDAGGRFEVEILRTGEVSLTCEGNDPEDPTLAIEVINNGPGIRTAVDNLIVNAWAKLNPEKDDPDEA